MKATTTSVAVLWISVGILLHALTILRWWKPSSSNSMVDYDQAQAPQSSFLPPTSDCPIITTITSNTTTAATTSATKPRHHSSSISLKYKNSCDKEMARIFTLQECFRSHDDPSQQQLNPNCVDVASQPLHNYAWYMGQGFGRIIDHTVEGCMLAAVLLNRPCTIDFDVRDMYYTWRSFLTFGNHYNWDWNIISHVDNIQDAHSKLPTKDADEWKTTKTKTNIELPTYPDVLPMVWDTKNLGNAKQHLHYWKNENREKILLSPNWGRAWWGKINVYKSSEEISGCSANHLRTRLQNAMYVPTILSKNLHMERKLAILGSSNVSYGAIHLRSTKANLAKTYYDRNEIFVNLMECLEKYNNVVVDKWWLISDNETATEYIMEQQRLVINKGDNNNKIINLYTDDSPNFQEENTHSGYAMKQKFYQSKMAPAIQDFMVLHESKIAIVTHGAFGTTGARGNGKVELGKCGSDNKKLFTVFGMPTTE